LRPVTSSFCSKSQSQQVVNYVLNQPQHHKKKTLRQEYIEFLNAFEIDLTTGICLNFIIDKECFDGFCVFAQQARLKEER
jgi:hypothetical protein